MKKIWILFVAAALAVGCSDNKSEEGGEVQNQLTLSAESLSFLVDGTSVDGNNTVVVTSDGDWRIAGYESWCTPSVTSGKSGDKVTFTVVENPSDDARTATYTFIRGNNAQKLVVSQLQNSVFEVTGGGTFTLNYQPQTITFIARTNFEIAPEIDVPWIVSADAASTRGVQTQFLRFVVEANPDYSGRSGKITIQDIEGVEHELIVTQNQQHAVLLGKKIYDVDAVGGTVTVSLQSNVDYTVSLSGYAWITEDTDGTRALNPSQKIFRIAESEETRQGQIIFKYSPTDGAPAIVDTVLIAQRVGATEKVTVPDANFRYYLRKNNYVLSKPGEAVCEMTVKGKTLTSMTCSSLSIASLEGIGAFTALTSLSCGYNNLTKLDLSSCAGIRSLTISFNLLQEVILHPQAPLASLTANSLRSSDGATYSPKFKLVAAGVTRLSCYNNRLDMLDVSECSSLVTLDCYNSQIANLDISGCVGLKTLNCYTNQLKTLDVRNNLLLTSLNCSGNKLETLDVAGNTALTSINCSTNALKTLDVSTNLLVTTLNCSTNPDMKTLYMAEGQTIRTLTKDEQTEIVRK